MWKELCKLRKASLLTRVLACSRAHVLSVLSCCVLTCLLGYVLVCLACSRAYVLACLTCSRAHVFGVLKCLWFHVFSMLACFMFLCALISYMPAVLKYLTCLCACVLLWHLLSYFLYIWKVKFQKLFYRKFIFVKRSI